MTKIEKEKEIFLKKFRSLWVLDIYNKNHIKNEWAILETEIISVFDRLDNQIKNEKALTKQK
jgi:predicted transcriptional regulator